MKISNTLGCISYVVGHGVTLFFVSCFKSMAGALDCAQWVILLTKCRSSFLMWVGQVLMCVCVGRSRVLCSCFIMCNIMGCNKSLSVQTGFACACAFLSPISNTKPIENGADLQPCSECSQTVACCTILSATSLVCICIHLDEYHSMIFWQEGRGTNLFQNS